MDVRRLAEDVGPVGARGTLGGLSDWCGTRFLGFREVPVADHLDTAPQLLGRIDRPRPTVDARTRRAPPLPLRRPTRFPPLFARRVHPPLGRLPLDQHAPHDREPAPDRRGLVGQGAPARGREGAVCRQGLARGGPLPQHVLSVRLVFLKTSLSFLLSFPPPPAGSARSTPLRSRRRPR